MFKLDIVVPSKGRVRKLEGFLYSVIPDIVKYQDINLYVYLSDRKEYDYIKIFLSHFSNAHVCWLPIYRVPNFWNDHLRTTTADAMCCANDDVIFLNKTIDEILSGFKEHFPDYDGVVGLNQSNLPTGQALDSAFPVIGKRYADRFPERQAFCPDYDRFYCDKELGEYAKSINRFYFASKAEIIHLHPCVDKRFEDLTHYQVREYLQHDKQTWLHRSSQRWLWGRDFNRVDRDL